MKNSKGPIIHPCESPEFTILSAEQERPFFSFIFFKSENGYQLQKIQDDNCLSKNNSICKDTN